ncbi:hypothetical protein PTSG_05517 [Salpingoeca rosetta]|uniref:DH domain-containing protein n=1 Tax=Salpingoeca rosetta (strain ATCC 50818 / BSB-021) TaxID=946362 RepID=F2UBF7_SALR5|nr:uncharacterized protein PTSG_05517 [Salpingoeca rosetta]EGD73823.1 hypothetical protein PTSG_05517 [Salpingoeca rosetta]|eukprot:XP_004993386.1 hypothetical protein PTSG_05517 [Salpingoeca rosetta]
MICCLVVQVNYLEQLSAAGWLTTEDKSAIVTPLQRVVSFQQELVRQLDSKIQITSYAEACPVSVVLLSFAFEILDVYTTYTCKLPAAVHRCQELFSTNHHYRTWLSQSAPLVSLPDILRRPLNHAQSYISAFEAIGRRVPATHPAAAQVSKCASFLRHLSAVVDTIDYVKAGELGMKTAHINAWRGPTMDQCGPLLLTCKVKTMSAARSDSAQQPATHLLLLFAQRLILISVSSVAHGDNVSRQYSLERTIALHSQQGPALRRAEVETGLLLRGEAAAEQPLLLLFPSRQDAEQWLDAVTMNHMDRTETGADAPAWPASFVPLGVHAEDIVAVHEASELDGRQHQPDSTETDGLQEFEVVSSYLGSRHTTRPLNAKTS